MEWLYLDSSVFGGYYDKEFTKWSKVLIDTIIRADDYHIIFSEVLDGELADAPEQVKNVALDIPESKTYFVALEDSAIALADTYIEDGVVGKTSRADCLHIALATLNNADVLVSWNFKHIVNYKKIRGYNAVNYKFGYKILDIRTPREILGDAEK